MQSKNQLFFKFLFDWLVSVDVKEFYIVESGFTTDDAFEIIDENRGQIYVKELPSMDDDSMMTIDQEPEQG